MNFLKKSMAILVVFIIAALSLLVSVSADESAPDPYGNGNEGIITSEESPFSAIPPTAEFLNSGFNDGLRYWANLNGGKTSDLCEVVASGENRFIKLNLSNKDSIISSVKFRITKEYVHFGRQLAVLYDWSGDDNFDIRLQQSSGTASRIISTGIGKNIYEAKNSNEWNTTVTAAFNPLFEPKDNAYYFSIQIELRDIEPSNAKIDNFRIVSISQSGDIYDLDGNLLDIIPRRTDSADTHITTVTKIENVAPNPEGVGGTELDKKTIWIFCSVCGAALCIMMIAVVMMLFNKEPSKKNLHIKASVKEDEYDEDDE